MFSTSTANAYSQQIKKANDSANASLRGLTGITLTDWTRSLSANYIINLIDAERIVRSVAERLSVKIY